MILIRRGPSLILCVSYFRIFLEGYLSLSATFSDFMDGLLFDISPWRRSLGFCVVIVLYVRVMGHSMRKLFCGFRCGLFCYMRVLRGMR